MFLGKILVIFSSAHQLELTGDKVLETGFYLNEFGIPADFLANRGYQLVPANPKGNRPVVDPSSDDPAFFNKDEEHYRRIKSFVENLPGFERPKTFGEVLEEGLDGYDGLLVPGGHAPMADLIIDPHLGRILEHFHQAGKPTAMICHGPAAALSAQADPGGFLNSVREAGQQAARGWIYAGYEMTVFSNIEERLAELKMPGRLKFYAETALKQAGARMNVAWIPGSSKVVVDRELITAQNPASDDEFGRQFLALLVDRALAVTR